MLFLNDFINLVVFIIIYFAFVDAQLRNFIFITFRLVSVIKEGVKKFHKNWFSSISFLATV